jgi:hypothetical protein
LDVAAQNLIAGIVRYLQEKWALKETAYHLGPYLNVLRINSLPRHKQT